MIEFNVKLWIHILKNIKKNNSDLVKFFKKRNQLWINNQRIIYKISYWNFSKLYTNSGYLEYNTGSGSTFCVEYLEGKHKSIFTQFFVKNMFSNLIFFTEYYLKIIPYQNNSYKLFVLDEMCLNIIGPAIILEHKLGWTSEYNLKFWLQIQTQ